jgi:hypothetical protein
MSLLHDDDRADLEDGVRSMLHRLAADVHETQPAWGELVGPHDARPARLAPVGSVPEVRNRPAARPHRARLTMAAAAAVLLAVGGAVALARPGDDTVDAPATETIGVISPGEADFDAGAAAAVWATGIDDPVAAATAYLGTVGVPVDAATAPEVVLEGTAEATAVVEWSVPGAPDQGGTVYLRSSSVAGAAPTWTVVGSAASDVALADVSYDGTELSFTVAGTAAPADQLAVGVWIDGQPVSLGGDAVARADAAGVSLGEYLAAGQGIDTDGTVRLPVTPDDIVTLRVVHAVDGVVRSVTQMAVALPEADPEVAATGLPAVDAAAEAAGQVDAGGAGAEGSADVEGGTTLPGGLELPPGVTVPTLPELPPLPLPPIVPGLPTPTLPVPTTVPGPLSGLP